MSEGVSARVLVADDEPSIRFVLRETLEAMGALIAYADRLVHAGLELIPDGCYRAQDSLEDDGFGTGPILIQAALTVTGGSLTIDFDYVAMPFRVVSNRDVQAFTAGLLAHPFSFA